MDITQEHVGHWREHGFMVVPEFLGRDVVDAALEEIEEILATPIETRNDGIGDEFHFPFTGQTLNHVLAEPRLVAFLEEAMETRDVAITDSVFWPKDGAAADYNQSLHVDYDGTTLTVPRDEGDYRQLLMAVYYTDVTEDLGPTYIVSEQYTREVPMLDRHLRRDEWPDVYEHERPIIAPAGSLLLWGVRTWHRGSAFTDRTGHRYAQFATYSCAKYPWMKLGLHYPFKPQGGPEALVRFLEEATPRARELVGFPSVDHDFWTEQTIAETAARYAGMDMTPYREALASPV